MDDERLIDFLEWSLRLTDVNKLTASIERCIAEGRAERRDLAERAKKKMLER